MRVPDHRSHDTGGKGKEVEKVIKWLEKGYGRKSSCTEDTNVANKQIRLGRGNEGDTKDKERQGM